MEHVDELTVTNLSKTYGIRHKNKALNNVSINVTKGECVAIVGPNGAGKTTLIKILAGIGGNFKGKVKTRSKIGYCPEVSVNIGYLDAYENLRYYTYMSTGKKNIDEEVLMLKLPPRDQIASTFSKGMKRKLDISRALSIGASILILDEPFDGLDPIVSFELADLITRLKENGKTIFFSSHDLARVEDIADRVYFIINGKIEDEISLISKNIYVIKFKNKSQEVIGLLSELGCKVINKFDNEISFQTNEEIETITNHLVTSGILLTELRNEGLERRFKRLMDEY